MQSALLLFVPGKILLLYMLDRVLCCCSMVFLFCESSCIVRCALIRIPVVSMREGGHIVESIAACSSSTPTSPSSTIKGGGGMAGGDRGGGTTCTSHTDVAETTSLTCGSVRICSCPQQMSQRVESSSLKQVFAGMVQVHPDAFQQHF